jgi:hypothetical protein
VTAAGIEALAYLVSMKRNEVNGTLGSSNNSNPTNVFASKQLASLREGGGREGAENTIDLKK